MPLGSKIFIAQQGATIREEVLASLLATVKKAHPQWRVGASVSLAAYKPTTVHEKLQTFDPIASFAVADPATHKLDLPPGKRGRGFKFVKYLQCDEPHKKENAAAIVDEALELQVKCGRKILISPSLTYGLAPGQANRRATQRFAVHADSHSLTKGRELMIGVALHESVVADEEERNDLLNEFVDDWPERPMYLRMCVTPPESYRQYSKVKALSGLRELVKSLVKNGRRVYLPHSGLFGWLMMPFGAAGFGSGITSTDQSLAIRGGGGNAANRIDWYFVPQFLGFVKREEVPRIASVGAYQPCKCPFCPTLPLGKPGHWDINAAGLHYLWWCARLAAEQNQSPSDVLAAAKKRVADGLVFQKTVREAKVILDPRSSPTHLGAWSEVLAAA